MRNAVWTKLGARVRKSTPRRHLYAGGDAGDYATVLANLSRRIARRLLSVRRMVGGCEKALSFSPEKTLVQDPQCLTLEPQIPGRQPLLNTSPICASRLLSPTSPISSFLPFVFLSLCRLRPGFPTRSHRVGARCPYIPFLACSCIEYSNARRPYQPAFYYKHT
jgi:hypothetical protein